MELKEKIRLCRRCFAFADQELCPLCADPARSPGQILVVAEPGDLLAIEKDRAGSRASTTSWAG